jgi:DNA-binding IclR family transcriptional regulator
LPESKYAIQSLIAALDVMESFFKVNRGQRGVTEIARTTGLNKSRVFRILDTLVQRGYVVQDPMSLKYSLGPACLRLGEAYRQHLDLTRVAQEVMETIAEESGDASHLLVLAGDQAVTLDIKRGRHLLQASEAIGEAFPLNIGCGPRILLAYLPEARRSELIASMALESYTENTTTDRDELERELALIREQGYWASKDDYEAGIFAVGAPVRDQTGRVIAAISLTTPEVRHDEIRERENADLVIEAAAQLSSSLGYRGGGE